MHSSGGYFGPRLEFWGLLLPLSALLPPALLAAPMLGACVALGPVLRQTRLIEREGCSVVISSDSSVLPEVGVPPPAESFHSKITVLSCKKERKENTGRATITLQLANGAR